MRSLAFTPSAMSRLRSLPADERSAAATAIDRLRRDREADVSMLYSDRATDLYVLKASNLRLVFRAVGNRLTILSVFRRGR